jgi:hypothetical protein
LGDLPQAPSFRVLDLLEGGKTEFGSGGDEAVVPAGSVAHLARRNAFRRAFTQGIGIVVAATGPEGLAIGA